MPAMPLPSGRTTRTKNGSCQLALELVGERDVLVEVVEVLADVAGRARPGSTPTRHGGGAGHGEERREGGC